MTATPMRGIKQRDSVFSDGKLSAFGELFLHET